jgi:glycosyltransferase involved in cell wall biosynthesis
MPAEGAGAASLTVVILTYNEEQHIDRAIASLAALSPRVVVVDSGSRDQTVALAKARGAEVLVHPFVNQAQQFQWAMDHAAVTSDWVMRLDADEVIEADLAAEILTGLPTLPRDVTGVNLRRKHIFMGRWIRHGGRFPLTMLRLWRRNKAHIEQRWMDEHMVLEEGRAVTFLGGFADHNLGDLTHFTAKHNAYATREAIDVLGSKYGLVPEQATAGQASWRAGGKRLLKEQLYNRLPFWVSATSYFLFRYIVQLGFLDGREGLIYHALQAGWYRFLVGARVLELERAIAPLKDRQARIEALGRLTGFDLGSGGVAGDLPGRD